MRSEPCIRGHRSTKCTHANERLMVPVRKPGRPLSSCPHPSSRPCTCTAVTAAIPRKQKCGCGSGENGGIKTEPASAPQTPLSPSKTNSSAFRVQKQAKGGSSRKQSIDISGLQRMDADQLNLISPPGSAASQHVASSSGHSTPVSDMPLYNPQVATSSSNGIYGAEQPIYPAFPYPLASPMMPASASVAISSVNGNSGTASVTSSEEPKKKCCGGSDNHGGQDDYPGGSEAKASSKGSNGAATASCCSSRSEPQENKANITTSAMGPPSFPYQPNGAMMPPMQHPLGSPVAMHNGMFVFYAHPGIFNYPPQYGSYMQPLQPEQWRQFMTTMGPGQMPAPSQAFGMANSVGPPQQQEPQQTATKQDETSWTSHQCNCGESCQCIGCAAHPYNEATQNYVRSAWNSMAHDSRSANGHAETNGNGNITNGDIANVSSNAELVTGSTTPTKAHSNGSLSPVPPCTPSEAASGTSEEQTLSANDFFFVSYPFGDSCSGETVSCPCGDDCQCIGCTIHNNPGPDGTPGDGML